MVLTPIANIFGVSSRVPKGQLMYDHIIGSQLLYCVELNGILNTRNLVSSSTFLARIQWLVIKRQRYLVSWRLSIYESTTGRT